MKNEAIDSLRHMVVGEAGICGNEACSSIECRAFHELVRRLRELVPLLEAINGDAALRPECAFIRVTVKEALALTKGGEEER